MGAVDRITAPKRSTSDSLEPLNVTLHGKRDLADVIKLVS